MDEVFLVVEFILVAIIEIIIVCNSLSKKELFKSSLKLFLLSTLTIIIFLVITFFSYMTHQVNSATSMVVDVMMSLAASLLPIIGVSAVLINILIISVIMAIGHRMMTRREQDYRRSK